MQASWNGQVIATSDRCIEIEGNQYFPPDEVDRACLRPSTTETFCSWKGTASYFDVVVGDQVNKDAAWYYPTPMDAAAEIRDYVAFWHGVEIS